MGVISKGQEKMVKELLELFTQMDFTDILGFGRILKVEEQENFTDFISEICCAFVEQPRIKRKQLMKLAKDVVGANKDLDKEKGTPDSATV